MILLFAFVHFGFDCNFFSCPFFLVQLENNYTIYKYHVYAESDPMLMWMCACVCVHDELFWHNLHHKAHIGQNITDIRWISFGCTHAIECRACDAFTHFRKHQPNNIFQSNFRHYSFLLSIYCFSFLGICKIQDNFNLKNIHSNMLSSY